jgi:hypothetical protein
MLNLKNQSVTHPSFSTLQNFCTWLSSNAYPPKHILWDIIHHFTAYNKNKKHKTPYYPDFVARGNRPLIIPYEENWNDRLITHTIGKKYLETATNTGFLQPGPESRVCFASGQIVSSGGPNDILDKVTFVFDRKILDEVYQLLPYADHDCEWEKEVRAHEPISLKLSIGYFESYDLFSELVYWDQATTSFGKKTLKNWETEYLKTGKIKDLKNIHQISQSI